MLTKVGYGGIADSPEPSPHSIWNHCPGMWRTHSCVPRRAPPRDAPECVHPLRPGAQISPARVRNTGAANPGRKPPFRRPFRFSMDPESRARLALRSSRRGVGDTRYGRRESLTARRSACATAGMNVRGTCRLVALSAPELSGQNHCRVVHESERAQLAAIVDTDASLIETATPGGTAFRRCP